MSYQINFTVEQNYLRVDVSGKRVRGKEVENAVSLFSQIAKVCRAKRLSRILVVSRVAGTLSLFSVFKVVKTPEKIGWDRRFKIAYVDCNEESKEEVLMGETFVVNRGYRMTKVFTDEKTALAWLLDTPGNLD